MRARSNTYMSLTLTIDDALRDDRPRFGGALSRLWQDAPGRCPLLPQLWHRARRCASAGVLFELRRGIRTGGRVLFELRRAPITNG